MLPPHTGDPPHALYSRTLMYWLIASCVLAVIAFGLSGSTPGGVTPAGNPRGFDENTGKERAVVAAGIWVVLMVCLALLVFVF